VVFALESDSSRANGFLKTVAGVILLVALAVAPLNFGSTRPLAWQTLIAMTATGGAVWFFSCLLNRRWPKVPLVPCVGALLIAVAASLWIFLLPLAEMPSFTARHLSRLVARWPYSIVPRDFGLVIAWASAAIVAWFALVDLARKPVWRSAIAWVMVSAGAAVALLGLLQNATRAPGIYWDDSVRMPGAFFGTFFHHTSAGAFLNTAWPLGFALALDRIRHHRPTTARSRLLIYGSLICSAVILAAHSGHVSRLPQVIAIVALVACVFWVRAWRAMGRMPELRWATGAVCAMLLTAVIGFGATRLDHITARWNLLNWDGLVGGRPVVAAAPVEEWPKLMRHDLFVPSKHGEYPLGDRGAAYATAWAAGKIRPWLGWGPGGWTAAAAATSNDPFIRTFFLMVQFTHNDYLQTWVEWGLIGAAGWALLVPGSVVNAFKQLGSLPSRDLVGAAAAVALGCVLVQSLIDFPLQIPAVAFNAIALSALAWTVPSERIPFRCVSSSSLS
jgi:hypothetical protein